MTGYTQSEIDGIAENLKEGLSASKIAERLSMARRELVSRNAIIGIVHRNKSLKAIGFANATGGRPSKGRPQKQTLRPSVVAKTPAKPVAAKCPAPYQLPGRLFIAAIEDSTRESAQAYELKTPSPLRPALGKQAHFVAMRFVDCLFDRCRAPLSSDLHEKPGPDMLCCGFFADLGKSYCTYHDIRLTNRQRELEAVAA